MSDIVKELRLMNIDLSHRAADRIEELEARVKELEIMCGMVFFDDKMKKIPRDVAEARGLIPKRLG